MLNTGWESRRMLQVRAPQSVHSAWDLPADYKEESLQSISWCGLAFRSAELADFVKWLKRPDRAEEKLDTLKLCAHCALDRFQIFPILLDLKCTVNHPHGTAFWHGNHVPMSMLWKRQSTVAYLILHPHTLIFHSISWIICPATASLEQKFRDSWCSSVRLIL